MYLTKQQKTHTKEIIRNIFLSLHVPNCHRDSESSCNRFGCKVAKVQLLNESCILLHSKFTMLFRRSVRKSEAYRKILTRIKRANNQLINHEVMQQ